MTDDLVAFLRERLDEDDQAARDCSGRAWWEHPKNWVSAPPLNRIALVVHDGDRGHIVRHDPARVLAEVEAKRRLLDQTYPELQWADDAAESEWSVHQEAALDFLKILALPYRDHPGYRPEWAPSA